MRSILTILFLCTVITSLGQKKWIGLWETSNCKYHSSYVISSDSFDIHRINVPGVGIWLVCVADSEHVIEKNITIISQRKCYAYDYYNNGYFWSGVIGDKIENYIELPDGHWLAFKRHYTSRKKDYCAWDKYIVNGSINGRMRIFDTNRNIKEIIEFKNGLKNGFNISYYENSRIQGIFYYREGNFIEERIFDESGNIKFSRIKGENNKTWNKKSYLTDYAEIDSNLNYNGLSIGYHNNGAISYSGKFLHGKKDSVWYYYHIDGNIKKQELWKNGKLINEK